MSELRTHRDETRGALAGAGRAEGTNTSQFPNLGAALLDVASRYPERIAIEFCGREITFAELSLAAQRAASLLCEYGVGLGHRVAVALDRSVEALVAMLAAHQLGAAYVAIAPNIPSERLRTTLAELRVRCCIAAPDFPALDVLQKLSLPVLTPDLLRVERPPTSQTWYSAAHVANVLHTSGSTGAPKAVANSHAGLMNRLEWMRRELAITEQDVIVQKTPYAFDVSGWEVFLPIVTGAKLLLAKPGGHMDPWYIGALLDAGATCIHFVPSMLDAFLAACVDAKSPWKLRHLICSGEALGAELIYRAREVFPGAAMHNYYGPTEASIDVTRWRVDATEMEPRRRVPIGRPAPGVQAFVLDSCGERAAPGQSGELCLGGVQLAHGYLNSAAATAAKFLPNPYGQRPGERMYATGDFSSEREDGLIDFLGRKDGQVKIRGMRVELEEIERVISRLCGIDRCIAVAEHDQVFLLMLAGSRAKLEYEALQSELPEHMIPRRVVEITEFPLTISGKIDRRRALELARCSPSR